MGRTAPSMRKVRDNSLEQASGPRRSREGVRG